MKTGLSQSASLRQELKINPRLYQAMDLLYMPLLDLQQHLSQELLVNPFLELVEPEDDEQEADQESEAEGATAATGVTVYVAVDDLDQVPASLEGVMPLAPAASAPSTDDDAVLVDDTGHIRASLRIAPYASLSRCVTSLL